MFLNTVVTWLYVVSYGDIPYTEVTRPQEEVALKPKFDEDESDSKQPFLKPLDDRAVRLDLYGRRKPEVDEKIKRVKQ